jgi:dTDP-4-dehydrorhamnose 3,5-epimerase-like enzyme
MNTIDDVRYIGAQFINDRTARLSIFQADTPAVPFAIRRIFIVDTHEKVARGHHAHRKCMQAMACLAGACDISVDDGTTRMVWHLAQPSQVVIVPPQLWCSQSYADRGTILMVMCDREYEESDYIRDYDRFLAYRNGKE